MLTGIFSLIGNVVLLLGQCCFMRRSFEVDFSRNQIHTLLRCRGFMYPCRFRMRELSVLCMVIEKTYSQRY
ncbi:hypothetical protein RJT34_19302 [Clitoria ternatea]|uniref:Secreted protein n=1 Tax=Clitoria ternatea TaxID=43366 RepID=A0AAN9P3H1_CLITE